MLLNGQEAAAAEGLRQLELAAFPTSLEWHTWWNVKKATMEMTYPWERGIIDAVTRLIRNQLTLCRQIRNEGNGKQMIKYDSDGHIYGQDAADPAEFTREGLRWYIAVIDPLKKDAPEWAQHLFKAVEGCYIQQARLGLEQSAIKRKGYLTLNASAKIPVPSERDLRDKGMAAFDQFSPMSKEEV